MGSLERVVAVDWSGRVDAAGQRRTLVNKPRVARDGVGEDFDVGFHAGALDGVFHFGDCLFFRVTGGEAAVEMDIGLSGDRAKARRFALDVADGDRAFAEERIVAESLVEFFDFADDAGDLVDGVVTFVGH